MDQVQLFLAGRLAGCSTVLKKPVQMSVSLYIELLERLCFSHISNYPEEENGTKTAVLEQPLQIGLWIRAVVLYLLIYCLSLFVSGS